MMTINNILASAALLVCLSSSAYCEEATYKGLWNSEHPSSFMIKGKNLIKYCFGKDPCSDLRFKGNPEKIKVTFPANGDYAGGYMELIKQPDGTYFGEFYYGNEAAKKIGTKSEAVFKAG